MQIIELPMGYAVKARVRGKIRLTNQHQIKFLKCKKIPLVEPCVGHAFIAAFKVALMKASELGQAVLVGGNGRYITVVSEDISNEEKLNKLAEEYKKIWWKLCTICADKKKSKKYIFYRPVRKILPDPNG